MRRTRLNAVTDWLVAAGFVVVLIVWHSWHDKWPVDAA